MKKVVIALAAALLVVVSMFASYAIYEYNTNIVIPEGSKQYFRDLYLRGYENNGRYYIVQTNSYFTPEKMVEFTNDRQLVRNQGWTLIEDMDIKELLGLSFDEIKAKLGDQYFIHASGSFVLAYITENGYLITARLGVYVFVLVEKYDLLTYELVEEYQFTEEFDNN